VGSGVVSERPSSLKALFFDIFMSVVAISILGLIYGYIKEWPPAENNYWGLLVTVAFAISLIRQAKVFRIMAISLVVGSLVFWAYRDVRPGKMSNHDALAQLLVASFVTICGLFFLRL
jgi:hypothetical protein